MNLRHRRCDPTVPKANTCDRPTLAWSHSVQRLSSTSTHLSHDRLGDRRGMRVGDSCACGKIFPQSATPTTPSNLHRPRHDLDTTLSDRSLEGRDGEAKEERQRGSPNSNIDRPAWGRMERTTMDPPHWTCVSSFLTCAFSCRPDSEGFVDARAASTTPPPLRLCR